MTHRQARRLVVFCGRALVTYGLLMTLILVVALVYFALLHEPPPD